MFTAMLSNLDSSIEMHFFDVIAGQFPENIDSCDAYMASGSKASVNDDLPWVNALERFIWQLFIADKAFVGICFGHQMIAKALGGKVACSDKGWGVGIATTLVHAYKPWMLPKKEQIKLIVSHQEQVCQLPPETQVLMGNDFCPYAMIQVGKHFLGLQGHPEFTRVYSKALMKRRKAVIAKRAYQQGIDSLTQQADDQLMVNWIICFLKQVVLSEQ
jgi:GMP synthase-like glutamine amidotransferase